MNFLIIGAGSLGSMFGGLLAPHHLVSLVGRHEHASAISSRGLTLSGAVACTVDVHASDFVDPHFKEHRIDYIIIATKCYDTELAATQIKGLIKEDTHIVSLQNGVGNEEVMREALGMDKIISVVTTNAAKTLGPGEIEVVSVGRTEIGDWTGSCDTQRVFKLQAALDEAGIPCKISADIKRSRYHKLLLNAAINPVAATMGITNGEVSSNPEARALATTLLEEGMAVLEKEGYSFSTDLIDHCFSICEQTADNINSMLVDVRNGKRTEVDCLNGVIVRLGQQHGVATPVNEQMVARVHAKGHVQ